jgi:hypothetical protein
MRRALFLLLLAACDGSDATYAAVTNQLGPGGPTVYKVWYRTTLFTEPVSPGNDSPVHVVAPGGGVAYALLAPGWDPDAGPPRSVLGGVTGTIGADKGKVVRIEIAPDKLRTACSAGGQLARDEYDVLRERIFPGEPVAPFDQACGGADAGAD